MDTLEKITVAPVGAVEVPDSKDVIAEALAVIDRSLGQLVHRELVSTSEMTDLLLDVRSLLSEHQN